MRSLYAGLQDSSSLWGCPRGLLWQPVQNMKENRCLWRKQRYFRIALPETGSFVFLSDLHENEFGPENEQLIAAIDRIKPDGILIGGDSDCHEKGTGKNKSIGGPSGRAGFTLSHILRKRQSRKPHEMAEGRIQRRL